MPKHGGKLPIKPSKKNVKAFLDGIRKTAGANKTAKRANLTGLPNPKTRGWANYHKAAVAKGAFSKVGHEVWKTPWQRAERRHPRKLGPWIEAKHFKAKGNRNWVFAADASAKNGGRRIMEPAKAEGCENPEACQNQGRSQPIWPQAGNLL